MLRICESLMLPSSSVIACCRHFPRKKWFISRNHCYHHCYFVWKSAVRHNGVCLCFVTKRVHSSPNRRQPSPTNHAVSSSNAIIRGHWFPFQLTTWNENFSFSLKWLRYENAIEMIFSYEILSFPLNIQFYVQKCFSTAKTSPRKMNGTGYANRETERQRDGRMFWGEWQIWFGNIFGKYKINNLL